MRIPRTLAFLGVALDCVIETPDGRRVQHTFKPLGAWALCADQTRRRLWVVRRRVSRRGALRAGDRSAADTYRRWAQLEPVEAEIVELSPGEPRPRGRIGVLAYRSSKWTGRKADYEHQFTRPPMVTDAGDVWRISGPSVRVQPRGIVG